MCVGYVLVDHNLWKPKESTYVSCGCMLFELRKKGYVSLKLIYTSMTISDNGLKGVVHSIRNRILCFVIFTQSIDRVKILDP